MGAVAWIAILVIDAIVSAYICGMVAGEKGYTVWSAVCMGFLFGALAVIVYWAAPISTEQRQKEMDYLAARIVEEMRKPQKPEISKDAVRAVMEKLASASTAHVDNSVDKQST